MRITKKEPELYYNQNINKIGTETKEARKLKRKTEREKCCEKNKDKY